MAGYRNLQHSAKTLFLKGRLALLWGVQVAVFPAYVAFQSIRTGYRRLQSQHPLQRLKGLLTGKPAQTIPMTADTPIRALLSAIQPQIAPQGGWLRPVNYHGSFLRQAHAGGVLTNGGWHLVPVKEPIRGIASDLATRKLVLVTVGNSIFEGLTADQQGRLESAIALLLAEYASQVKQHQLDTQRQQAGLPLPKAEPNQWFCGALAASRDAVDADRRPCCRDKLIWRGSTTAEAADFKAFSTVGFLSSNGPTEWIISRSTCLDAT